jgi:Family of unknown function (DUF5906)
MADPADVPLNVNQFDLWACPDGYIFIPNGAIWTASFVDKRLGLIAGLKASTWIAQNRAIEGMTWVPGEDQLLSGRLIVKSGWIDHPGARLFNLYQPPVINGGDASQAGRWVDLVKRVYPDTWWHITQWFAHRVQFPGVKINHALVFGGSTRVGKDTILKPLLYAVGYPNTASVAPTMLLERFNEFYETVVLVVSEARDLGDINRYQLYDHLKQYIAAPPETIMIDTKNVKRFAIPNLVGIIFTTNHKDGLYIPPDDARFHCSWSPLEKDDFTDAFWTSHHEWYAAGGLAHVAAYLRELDVSLFNPKKPPPHTEAFRDMVDAGRSPEAGEMSGLIEVMSNPPAVCLSMLIARCNDEEFRLWLKDRKNRKNVGRRLADADYTPVRNEDDKRDGQWLINSKRQVVYARRELPERERIAAARGLCVGYIGNVVDFHST